MIAMNSKKFLHSMKTGALPAKTILNEQLA